MDGVTVIDHPLVQHKLTIMRKKETSTAGFRRLLREISMLLCYEVTRDLDLTLETIETPITQMQAPIVEGKKLVFVSILRAGNGLLEGMLEKGVTPLIPEKGSVGASGDLAPLAHMAAVMMGEAEAFFQGERLSGAEALKRAGLTPVVLAAKEGLALINGTQASTALALAGLFRAHRAAQAALITGAL